MLEEDRNVDLSSPHACTTISIKALHIAEPAKNVSLAEVSLKMPRPITRLTGDLFRRGAFKEQLDGLPFVGSLYKNAPGESLNCIESFLA